MAENITAPPAIASHGSAQLPAVVIDSYNLESRDDEGFLGDRATKSAFRDIVENWRKVLRRQGDDPLGDEPSETLSKKQLDEILTRGDPQAAGIIQGAIEEFSQELALVIRRFLKLKGWRDTERIAIGGGFRAGRVGELAIGRAGVILKADKINIDLVPIPFDPDEAGLIGAVHLAPSWLFEGHDAILAADIGGTNFRAGLIELNLKRAEDLSKAAVRKIELWRHADEKVTRDEAVKKLARMIEALIEKGTKEGFHLAPFIGVGCPGFIQSNGQIERGAQNLPGNWTSKTFNLPRALVEAVPTIGGHDTSILMHNDAVTQGLSVVPFMQDVKRWGVLTIGTGLGNARFTNRDVKSD